MGVKTRQNFSGEDVGGGEVRYAEAMYVIRTGGCALMCVRDGEKEIWLSRATRGDGATR